MWAIMDGRSGEQRNRAPSPIGPQVSRAVVQVVAYGTRYRYQLRQSVATGFTGLPLDRVQNLRRSIQGEVMKPAKDVTPLVPAGLLPFSLCFPGGRNEKGDVINGSN